MGRFGTWLTAAAALALAASASAAEWVNLDEANKRGERKVSAAYLTGKVVLVCRSQEHAERLGEIWASFRRKNFVALGSFAKAPAGAKYPVYAGAGPEGWNPKSALCVVDAKGDVIYTGGDIAQATEAVVESITAFVAAPDYSTWRQYFDFEARALPGRAINDLAEVKKDKRVSASAGYKAAAKELAAREKELKANPAYVRLAKLEQLAAQVREYSPANKRARVKFNKAKIEAEAKKYADLKESEDPVVAREAKNCLADLAWAAAEL